MKEFVDVSPTTYNYLIDESHVDKKGHKKCVIKK